MAMFPSPSPTKDSAEKGGNLHSLMIKKFKNDYIYRGVNKGIKKDHPEDGLLGEKN